MISFNALWNHHPYPVFPCSQSYFSDQCTIRMGIAFRQSGVSLDSFRGAVCYPSLKHSPRHILRAEELANWMINQTGHFGRRQVFKNVTHADFVDKKGVVFILNGWGGGDHIDLWDGTRLKGGDISYFSRGEAVWFWEL